MTEVAFDVESLDLITQWAEPFYKKLHRNPELSMLESETVLLIKERLEELGLSVQLIGGGVVGTLENGEGKTVLFRADFDGLPIKEDTGVDFASTKVMEDADGNPTPVMHACGHDFHTTGLLSATQYLAEHKDDWAGTFIALFQPGEETAKGASSMVEGGLASKIKQPDVALSQHVTPSPAFTGEVAIGAGPTLSTATSMKIKVFGRGSHGSMPHLGIDPILLASSIVNRLQGIVAREVTPGEFAVVSIGSLNSGTKANIIPADAILQLNLRAYSEERMEALVEAVKRIVIAECQASNSPQEPEFETFDIFPLTNNDAEVAETVRASMVRFMGQERVKEMVPLTASEDFSFIPRALGVPYAYWVFGAYRDGDEAFPNHNPKFLPVLQPTLRTGTEAAISAALAYLAVKES